MKKKRRRNYRKEYDDYYGKKGASHTWTAKQRARRKHKTSRNAARAKMRRVFKSKLRHYHDIDHRDKNPLNNHHSNLRIVHRSKNRANFKN